MQNTAQLLTPPQATANSAQKLFLGWVGVGGLEEEKRKKKFVSTSDT